MKSQIYYQTRWPQYQNASSCIIYHTFDSLKTSSSQLKKTTPGAAQSCILRDTHRPLDNSPITSQLSYELWFWFYILPWIAHKLNSINDLLSRYDWNVLDRSRADSKQHKKKTIQTHHQNQHFCRTYQKVVAVMDFVFFVNCILHTLTLAGDSHLFSSAPNTWYTNWFCALAEWKHLRCQYKI